MILLIALPNIARADQENFLVLGIIASSDNQQGVALMKNVSSGKTFAARVGTEFTKKTVLHSVNRKTVEIVKNGRIYILRVGDETDSAQIAFASVTNSPLTADAFERKGDT